MAGLGCHRPEANHGFRRPSTVFRIASRTLLLDRRHKSLVRFRTCQAEGRDRRRRVHRRRPRPRRARRRWARGGRARIDPRAQRGGRAPPGGGTPRLRRRGPGGGRRRGRGPRLHARTTSTTRSRTRLWWPGSTSSARSRWPSTWSGPSGSPPAPGQRRGAWPWCPSPTGTTPGARGAPRGSPRARRGAVHLIHGTYLQDWLLTAEDANWRVDAALGGASRAFADIGSHWCDLAEFVTGHRVARLAARTLTAVPERRPSGNGPAFARGTAAASRGRWRPRTRPSSSSRPTAGRSARWSVAGVGGTQEPPLARGGRRRAGPWRSTRRTPRRCGAAAATPARWCAATPGS